MFLFLGETYEYCAYEETCRRSGFFKFKIVRKNGSYRAYVLERPPLNGRDSALSKVHMLRDGDRYYVCVVGDVETKDRMKGIARFWAKRYLRYAETGLDYNVK